MSHTTFRGDNEPAWKDGGNKLIGPQGDPAHGEAKSGKHSSAGKESQLRKEATHSEEAARAKHIAMDTKQHPMFNNRKPDTRG
jgi:hypothetical protein